MVHPALRAAETLEQEGIACEVVDLHTLRPLDREAVEGAARRRLLVTAEEHSVHGGLGSAVNDVLVERGLYTRRLSIGLPHEYPHADDYGCLLSTYLAERYKLAVGDSLTLFIPSAFGARNAMDFVIVGLFRASAPWYDEGVYVRARDYAELAELTGGLLPFYKCYVKEEAGIPAMTAALNARLSDFRAKGYRDDEFVRFLLSLGTSNILMFGFLAMVMFLAVMAVIIPYLYSELRGTRNA